MQRRCEPADPVIPPEAETRPTFIAKGDTGTGRDPGAPSGRDTGHHRSRSCAVSDDGTTAPVVAAPGPPPPVHKRRFFHHHPGVRATAAVGPGASPIAFCHRPEVLRPAAPLDALRIDCMASPLRSIAGHAASS